jgi:tetratricopeptide (TPR) repeat protein
VAGFAPPADFAARANFGFFCFPLPAMTGGDSSIDPPADPPADPRPDSGSPVVRNPTAAITTFTAIILDRNRPRRLDPLRRKSRFSRVRNLRRIASILPVLAACSVAAARADGEGFYGSMEVRDNERGLMESARATEEQFRRRGYLYDDPGMTALVTRVGRALAPKPADDYVRYRFFVLRDIAPNAFALPDGQIYVNTGLLALLENEAQIAAVLAHEVQHTAGHHGLLSYRSAKAKAIAGMVLGPLTLGVGDYLLARSVYGYSRDLESEADRLGLKKMVAAGYAPDEMIEMLEILGEDSEGENPEQRPSKWSTHPELAARAEAARAAIPGLIVGRKRGDFRTGGPEYVRLVLPVVLDTVEDLIAADYPRRALGMLAPITRMGAPARALFLSGEARRTLGARALLEGEIVLTNREKRRNLVRRIHATRAERQEELLRTEEGRATRRKNMEKAVAEYRRALAVDPGFAEAHRGIGQALHVLGRTKEAGQELVIYLRARPDAPDKSLIVDELQTITGEIRAGPNSPGGQP